MKTKEINSSSIDSDGNPIKRFVKRKFNWEIFVYDLVKVLEKEILN